MWGWGRGETVPGARKIKTLTVVGVEIRSLDGSPNCSGHTFTVHLSFKLFIEMGTTRPVSDIHGQAKNSGGLPWWLSG